VVGTLCLLRPAPAAAQALMPMLGDPVDLRNEAAVATDAAGKSDADSEPGAWAGDYGRWIKRAEKMALEELDFWGASSTMPQGFLVPAFGYGTMRAAQRFDQNRHLENIIPVFHVPDPFHVDDGRHFFDFNFNARGVTRGYLFGLLYGITDRVMIGATTMFADIFITMRPILIPGTCDRLGVATLTEFFSLMEKLGRPKPVMTYRSTPLDPGDTSIFVTWNFLRQTYVAAAITPKLILPTAHEATPNKNLIFALGPDLDTGAASWGVGLNPVLDFRLPPPLKIASFSLAGDGAVFAQAQRRSPKFLTPDRDVVDYLQSQHVVLDLFPDLSDMKAHYYYTPPPWVAVSGTLGVGPVSVGYRHGWGFAGEFQTNSPGFIKLIKTIGLVGNGDDGRLFFNASVPLTPLYIPGLFQFHTEYVTDGRNAMVFRDIYQMGAGFLIPVDPPPKYRLLDRKAPPKGPALPPTTEPNQPPQPPAPPPASNP
jgi:hypothetical protein